MNGVGLSPQMVTRPASLGVTENTDCGANTASVSAWVMLRVTGRAAVEAAARASARSGRTTLAMAAVRPSSVPKRVWESRAMTVPSKASTVTIQRLPSRRSLPATSQARVSAPSRSAHTRLAPRPWMPWAVKVVFRRGSPASAARATAGTTPKAALAALAADTRGTGAPSACACAERVSAAGTIALPMEMSSPLALQLATKRASWTGMPSIDCSQTMVCRATRGLVHSRVMAAWAPSRSASPKASPMPRTSATAAAAPLPPGALQAQQARSRQRTHGSKRSSVPMTAPGRTAWTWATQASGRSAACTLVAANGAKAAARIPKRRAGAVDGMGLRMVRTSVLATGGSLPALIPLVARWYCARRNPQARTSVRPHALSGSSTMPRRSGAHSREALDL